MQFSNITTKPRHVNKTSFKLILSRSQSIKNINPMTLSECKTRTNYSLVNPMCKIYHENDFSIGTFNRSAM